MVCQLHHNHLTKENMQSLCRDEYMELSRSVVMCMLPAILVYTSRELNVKYLGSPSHGWTAAILGPGTTVIGLKTGWSKCNNRNTD